MYASVITIGGDKIFGVHLLPEGAYNVLQIKPERRFFIVKNLGKKTESFSQKIGDREIKCWPSEIDMIYKAMQEDPIVGGNVPDRAALPLPKTLEGKPISKTELGE